MEIEELLIGEIGNVLGIAAGFHTVGRMRIQRSRNLSPQNAVRVGERSLHLIVNDTVIDQLVLIVQLVMPALLTENRLVLVGVRIENSVQINVHQVLEILVITARNRIYGLVGIGHGIQEGIQGTLCQFHKRILYREIL